MSSPAPALARNAALLLVGNAVSLLAPLITVPYVARVLGPEGWAPVLVAQAAVAWLAMVVDFGFDLSAVRNIAAAPDPARRAAIVQQVQSAKLFLAPVASVALLAIFLALPALRGAWMLLAASQALVWMRGLEPLWYFLGVERVPPAVTVQIIGKVGATVATFLLVHSPEDAWLVIGLQAAGTGLATAILTRWMRHDAPRGVPRWRDARAAMAEGVTLFGFRAVTGFVATGNVLLGGALLATPALAAFGAADRLIRAAIGTLHPLSQVVMPRVAAQRASGASASALIAGSLRVTGGIGLLIGLVTFFAAPRIVAILLGPGYEAAIPLLRALALLPPLVAVNTVLGVQWAIPFGRDREFFGAVTLSGTLNLVLAMLVAPRYGALGIIGTIVGAEAVQTLLLLRIKRSVR